MEATNAPVDEVTSNEAAASDSLLSNLFEKLFRLNQKLEVQEDDIFRLTLQVFGFKTVVHQYILDDLFIRV